MSNYIDQNMRNVGIAYIQGTDNMTIPLAISAINELLIEVIPIPNPLSAFNASNIKIDENTKNVAGAVTDDSNQTIIPLTTDSIAGLPCVRVEFV
jgi:hypothetical protein